MFLDRALLGSFGWSRTHYVAYSDLELMTFLLTSKVMGLPLCASTPIDNESFLGSGHDLGAGVDGET